MELGYAREVRFAWLGLAVASCTLAAGLDDLRFDAAAGTGGAASSSSATGGADDCLPGFADCDQMQGCEADLATDRENCGMCGRNCGADACADGVCPPLAIAVGQPGPYDIGFVGGYVYWLNWDTGEVQRCPSAGCEGAPEHIGESGYWSFYLDFDDTDIYWNNNGSGSMVGSMWRCPLAGCTTGEGQWIMNVTDPTAVAVAQSFVYWRSNTGAIERSSKTSAVVESILINTGNGEIAAYGDAIYWTERETSKVRGCEDPSAGCTRLSVDIDGFSTPSAIAVDDQYVYFGTESANEPDAVVRAERATGTFETLAEDVEDVTGIAISASHVYFVEGATGTLYAVPKDRSVPPTAVTGRIIALARVAVGDGFAFVTLDANPGQVWRYSL